MRLLRSLASAILLLPAPTGANAGGSAGTMTWFLTSAFSENSQYASQIRSGLHFKNGGEFPEEFLSAARGLPGIMPKTPVESARPGCEDFGVIEDYAASTGELKAAPSELRLTRFAAGVYLGARYNLFFTPRSMKFEIGVLGTNVFDKVVDGRSGGLRSESVKTLLEGRDPGPTFRMEYDSVIRGARIIPLEVISCEGYFVYVINVEFGEQ